MGGRGRAGIRLCGRFAVELSGERLEESLPGRKGRLAVAYLAVNRGRPVSRDELIDVLWPAAPPADPDGAISALLSKIRRALGKDTVHGRHELTLVLPEGATVDLEMAVAAVERAEAALAGEDWRGAWEQAAVAREVAGRGFLPGMDGSWVEDRRREFDELRMRALDCRAAAGIALGGAELGAGERAARELIEAAPFRESGHRLLMEALVARGDVADALQVYERLRILLRDELGTAPGPATQALHARLLRERPAAPQPHERPASQPPGEERKVVTALAFELAGRPATVLDPEDLRAEASRIRERLVAELERFGGSLERLAGAAAVAVFGARAAHEDDPERAVRAAMHLREMALAKAAGVATGEALVTHADPLAAATGRVIADAEELVEGVSGIVVDELTWKATRGAIDYEAHGAAWRARGARTVEPSVRARLVGRAHELAVLETLHRTVLDDSRPRLVSVVGQAGVGKTRLAEELVSRIATAGGTVHGGRCLPYGEGITYWPLREILWEAAGIALDDSGDDAAAKLTRRVRALFGDRGDAERVACALAITAGIALHENSLARMSPESVAEEVALAWPAFLSALAGEAPAVIVIEDLHWAEPPLIEMIERIVDRAAGRLLVVVTARPEFAESRPGWSSRPRMAQIGVEPLTDAQTRELVAELLPDGNPEIRARVVATAEGNPFFAEEIVRHLADESDGAIPDTVRALLAARIDRLADSEKRALQDAAVVGRAFWATTLAAMGATREIDAVLHSLERKGLVVTRSSSSLPGQTELWFRHGLTRDVAYRSIPRARRCRAHAAVAEWLSELSGDRRHEFIDLLAYHYEAASAPRDADLAWPPGSSEREALRERAMQALVDAGHAARKSLSLDQAVRFADRALALAATDAERLAGLELMARSHHAAVRGDEALDAYCQGIEIARGLNDAAAASKLRAHATLMCVRYSGAFSGDAWLRQRRTLLARTAADPAEASLTFEAGALLVGRAWGPARWDDPPTHDPAIATRDAAQAVAIAEEIDSPDLLGTALEALTWFVFEGGLCEAEAMGERLLRAGATLTDHVEIHEGIVTAAMCFAWAGRFERAAEVAMEATRKAARLSPHRALHAGAAATLCLVPSGRFRELGEDIGRMPELARAERDRLCSTGALAIAGSALWLFETLDRPAAQHALEILRQHWPHSTTASYGNPVAEILRPFVGVDAVRRALERPKARRDARLAVQRLRVELPLCALSREWDRLGLLTSRARALADAACAPALRWIADWADGVRLADSGDQMQGLERVAAATGALAGWGESYTGARLVVDALPFLDGDRSRRLAELTAARLEGMGALASAADARAAASVPAVPSG